MIVSPLSHISSVIQSSVGYGYRSQEMTGSFGHLISFLTFSSPQMWMAFRKLFGPTPDLHIPVVARYRNQIVTEYQRSNHHQSSRLNSPPAYPIPASSVPQYRNLHPTENISAIYLQTLLGTSKLTASAISVLHAGHRTVTRPGLISLNSISLQHTYIHLSAHRFHD